MPTQSLSRFPSCFQLSTVNYQLFSFNSLSFTLLSKNASANHLESHSCKNKGLKVPWNHTLTKNIGGEGVRAPGQSLPREQPRGARLNNEVRAEAPGQSLPRAHPRGARQNNRALRPISNIQPQTSNLRSLLSDHPDRSGRRTPVESTGLLKPEMVVPSERSAFFAPRLPLRGESRDLSFVLTPLTSTLTKFASASPLDSALTKNIPGGGGPPQIPPSDLEPPTSALFHSLSQPRSARSIEQE